MELKPSLSRQQTYKCLILGDSGVGKSTFLRRHATGQFRDEHVPTKGVQVYTLLLQTNYQDLALELWDVAGDERHGGLLNGYFFFAQCAIIMFDLNVARSAISVARWLHSLEQICGKQLPVVICGNKSELERMPLDLLYHQQGNLDYCEMSARVAWNLEAPLELLCRRLLQRNDLKLISQPTLRPIASCSCDEAEMRQHMEQVRQQILPEKSEETFSYKGGNFKDCIVLN
ncbi:GTP-binding nuclear protein Ran, testis-specific isoform-like [Drosophila innubila]|uniref:GTP-binding nuclear protein Ran, testis-specific isoform-like n=1 Tax=Drosophila innubila TaxID=198719 RepID=UPI00148BABCB|nr:GTP-binding nuclear protein Ran, testis-specific isoform-like [Drosophila innubila]